MPKVLMELSMSLDGYVAGPGVSPDEPMGRGGEDLHDWMFATRPADEVQQFQTDHFSTIGAVIVGRRMADLGIGPWGDEPTFHCTSISSRSSWGVAPRSSTRRPRPRFGCGRSRRSATRR